MYSLSKHHYCSWISRQKVVIVRPIYLVNYRSFICLSKISYSSSLFPPSSYVQSSFLSLYPEIYSLYIFLFSQQSFQPKFLPTANALYKLGYTLYGTMATAAYLRKHNIPANVVGWPLHEETPDLPNAARYAILFVRKI